ncbi:restriction endonuclease subunit S [Cellulophaga baltica]|uniref:restriction endonuclease subunit S n=1 Tax=Cellulophaga baltica TaxID=76594 RepID=UPI0037CA3205
MELEMRKGFKQTEFGTIPNDWKEVNLGKSSVLKARIGWQGLTTAEYLKTGDYFLITGTDFKNGYIDWDNCVYVERIRYDQDKNIQIKVEDVLVTKDGTIGKVAYVDKLPMKTTLNSGVFVIRPINNFYNTRYFYFVLRSRHFKEFLGKLTAGSTISHLYQKDFVHYSFPLPPTLAEQKAIATALSDVDDLISNVDALIAKKKAIKQGAMQQLLTPPNKGGKRLDGFDGEWVEIKLGDSAILKARIGWQGLTTAEYLKSGDYGLVTGTDFNNGFIDWKNCVFVKKERYVQDSNIQLKLNDVLVTKDGTIGKIALINSLPQPTTLNSGVFVIRAKNNVFSQKFFYHILMSSHFKEFLGRLTAGSTINHLYQKDFVHFNFFAPESIQEQKCIAQILSDMDQELEELATKKEKYEHIKQGMMQELLTGKTRLV